jgi:hypothetical protein
MPRRDVVASRGQCSEGLQGRQGVLGYEVGEGFEPALTLQNLFTNNLNRNAKKKEKMGGGGSVVTGGWR